MWRLTSNFLIVIIVLFALVIINVITFYTYQQMQKLKMASQWVIHSYQVIETSENLFGTVLLIENYGRAFLLTGDKDFIDELNLYKKQAEKEMNLIKFLTSDNSFQAENLNEFESYLTQRISLLDQMIALKQNNTVDKKRLLKDIAKSSILTEKINKIHSVITEEERKLLIARNQSVFLHSENVEFYTLLGDILSFLILATGSILLFNELRLRNIAEKKLHYLAYHDALTGLVNRTHLEKRIEETIQMSKRHDERMAVIFIDIDNFKHINDTYGHDAGDFVLQILAKRLLANVRNIDTVLRLGGDEFVIILSGVRKPSDVQISMDKVVSLMETEVIYKKLHFFITVSMGVSVYPEDGENSATLLKNADSAMYEAKRKIGSHIEYFRS